MTDALGIFCDESLSEVVAVDDDCFGFLCEASQPSDLSALSLSIARSAELRTDSTNVWLIG